MTSLHVVVPDGVDDPTRPSGGNVYDREICDGLAAAGWSVHEHPVPGAWPFPDAAATAALADVVGAIPDGATVLVDGLIGSTVPVVLAAAATRLRLVVLVHMPLGGGPPGDRVCDARDRERAALHAAAAVITTSASTRERLLSDYALAADRVHVAEPGTRPAAPASGTAGGGRLLCVAAVTRQKGHDLLLAALAGVRDLSWHCDVVGNLEREPRFVAELRRQAEALRVGGRVTFRGALVRDRLESAYAAADVLVLPSRAETFGMVVSEALARGLPVIATGVGGVPGALGRAPDGRPPGLLVRPADEQALAAALRCWLSDAGLRARLRRAAAQRRPTLPRWSATVDCVARVLDAVAA